MSEYRLGNGDDTFDFRDISDWWDTSYYSGAIYGEKGNDTIIAQGFHLYLDGGNGDDRITLLGPVEWGSTLVGGSGNDTLTAEGFKGLTLLGGDGSDELTIRTLFDGVLDGGKGADHLVSWSTNSELIPGAVGTMLTGGSGLDHFGVKAGSVADNAGIDRDGSGTVSQGDTVHAFMDVITDYQAGERIDLAPQDGPATYTQTDHVGIMGAESSNQLFMDDVHRYAMFAGTRDGDSFHIDQNGTDTLILYSWGIDPPTAYPAALAISNFTRFEDILIG